MEIPAPRVVSFPLLPYPDETSEEGLTMPQILYLN